jgi:hypothetical protein
MMGGMMGMMGGMMGMMGGMMGMMGGMMGMMGGTTGSGAGALMRFEVDPSKPAAVKTVPRALERFLS